jgi:hypothetical protein
MAPKCLAATSTRRSRKASQARTAAVPLRSVEAEAAVGEVLLFFSVEVGITNTAPSGKPN